MPYDRTPYTFPEPLDTKERSFYAVAPLTGGRVTGADIALMDRITIDRVSDVFNGLFYSGWFDIPVPATNSYDNFADNTLTILPLSGLMNGHVFILDGTNQADGNLVTLSAWSPTHLTDLIFIEFWTSQVDPAVGKFYRYGNVDYDDPDFFTNDTIDPDFGAAGATRIQLRYRLRVVPSALRMDDALVTVQGKKVTPDPTEGFTFDAGLGLWFSDTTAFADILDFDDVTGFVYALPICLVTRTDDSVGITKITDLRPSVRLRSDAVSPVNNIGVSSANVPSVIANTTYAELPVFTNDPRYIRLYTATPAAVSSLSDGIEATLGSITFTDTHANQFFHLEGRAVWTESDDSVVSQEKSVKFRIRADDAATGTILYETEYISEADDVRLPMNAFEFSTTEQAILGDDSTASFTMYVTVEANVGVYFTDVQAKLFAYQFFAPHQVDLPSSDLFVARPYNDMETTDAPLPTTDETQVGIITVTDVAVGQEVVLWARVAYEYTNDSVQGATDLTFRLREDNAAGTILDTVTLDFADYNDELQGVQFLRGHWTSSGTLDKPLVVSVKAGTGGFFTITSVSLLGMQLFPIDQTLPQEDVHLVTMYTSLGGGYLHATQSDYLSWEKRLGNNNTVSGAEVSVSQVAPGQTILVYGHATIKYDNTWDFSDVVSSLLLRAVGPLIGDEVPFSVKVTGASVGDVAELTHQVSVAGRMTTGRYSGSLRFALDAENIYDYTLTSPVIVSPVLTVIQFF